MSDEMMDDWYLYDCWYFPYVLFNATTRVFATMMYNKGVI